MGFIVCDVGWAPLEFGGSSFPGWLSKFKKAEWIQQLSAHSIKPTPHKLEKLPFNILIKAKYAENQRYWHKIYIKKFTKYYEKLNLIFWKDTWRHFRKARKKNSTRKMISHNWAKRKNKEYLNKLSYIFQLNYSWDRDCLYTDIGELESLANSRGGVILKS